MDDCETMEIKSPQKFLAIYTVCRLDPSIVSYISIFTINTMYHTHSLFTALKEWGWGVNREGGVTASEYATSEASTHVQNLAVNIMSY